MNFTIEFAKLLMKVLKIILNFCHKFGIFFRIFEIKFSKFSQFFSISVKLFCLNIVELNVLIFNTILDFFPNFRNEFSIFV